ncbi:MAG: DUF4372 domain-containing protein [Deferribacteres bacterium]|nr:DUF4372 domain-containing protein [Deferribacteres bacterium]
MNKFNSIFGQTLRLFPAVNLSNLSKKPVQPKGSKGFSCWSQFVAMLFLPIRSSPLYFLRDLWRTCYIFR